MQTDSLNAMLLISTRTCIMNEPHKIPKEASENIAQFSLSLNKEETPIPTEPVAEKNITSSFSSFPSPKFSPSASSTHAPCLPSTCTSYSSSSSTTSFSSSSSITNPSTQSFSSPIFLAPDPVDNLMVGASAASTVSTLDLSFLDKYSADYNNPVVERPREDCLSTPNLNTNLIWDDMQDILLNDKEKPEGASPISIPTFDLSSFDLTQFTNNYETFSDHQTDV